MPDVTELEAFMVALLLLVAVVGGLFSRDAIHTWLRRREARRYSQRTAEARVRWDEQYKPFRDVMAAHLALEGRYAEESKRLAKAVLDHQNRYLGILVHMHVEPKTKEEAKAWTVSFKAG